MLEAAETVAARDGASNLTLEAVAAEAGISKASVLYDYNSKQELLQAVIERRIAIDDAKVDRIRDKLGQTDNSGILAHLLAEPLEICEDERSVAMCLCAMVAQNAEIRRPVEALIRRRIKSIQETSEKPDGPMLAFLAMEGLKTLEWFGLHRWTDEERNKLIAQIRWLVEQTPEEVPRILPQESAPVSGALS